MATTEENDDESAIALAIAIAEQAHKINVKKHTARNNWRSCIDPKMPIAWHRVNGWTKISRQETSKGRGSW